MSIKIGRSDARVPDGSCAWSFGVLTLGEIGLLPPRASRTGAEVDAVFWGLISFSGFFTLLICGTLLYFLFRYRASAVTVNRANPVANVLRFEVVWITIPTVLALALFTWAANVYVRQAEIPVNAETIYIVGKQWMWKARHRSGRQEINTLHVPAGEPIKLVMTSQDVIHSFYIPAFRVKRDVLPDRYTHLWFEATEPGRYDLFCAEYCGMDHSQMRGQVIVMEQADYAAWLDAGVSEREAERDRPQQGALVRRGADLFYYYGCVACHRRDSAERAPRLDGLYRQEVRLRNDEVVIAAESYLRESILFPNRRIVAGYAAPSPMPTYRHQMTEAEVAELVEYIKTLQHGWSEAAGDATGDAMGDDAGGEEMR